MFYNMMNSVDKQMFNHDEWCQRTNTTVVLNALHFLLFTMSKSTSKHLVLLDVLKNPKDHSGSPLKPLVLLPAAKLDSSVTFILLQGFPTSASTENA